MNLAYNTDKRRYIRYELLDYAVMSLDGTTETVNVVITDIGLGGVQVRTRTQLISGSKVFIQVACTDGESLSLRGEIRHTVEIPNSDLFSAGVPAPGRRSCLLSRQDRPFHFPESDTEALTLAVTCEHEAVSIFQKLSDCLANLYWL